MKNLTDYVVFHDRRLAAKYARSRIPIATLYEAYFDGALDIPGDIHDLLENRNRFVTYALTPRQVGWALTRFIPDVALHSKERDERIVRAHYDRGDDFFGWFLGERMIHTTAFFQHADQSLERAQDNTLNLVCGKLQLHRDDRLLDIGSGWGALPLHAARYHDVHATLVTIAKNQAQFAERRAAEWGIERKVRVLCNDYRDIPAGKYDKICSLDMVEHVGVKNLRAFYEQVRELLDDDGLFCVQWTGMRRGLRPEDLMWSLFRSKHIVPGADANVCPSSMLAAMEKAGFETHSVENIGQHYGWTIRRWHDNWMANRDAVVAVYGERWFRIWNFFLAWSTIIARQGNAACYQVLLHKNEDAFDRVRFIGARPPSPRLERAEAAE